MKFELKSGLIGALLVCCLFLMIGFTPSGRGPSALDSIETEKEVIGVTSANGIIFVILQSTDGEFSKVPVK
jgi:hypothetical protein